MCVCVGLKCKWVANAWRAAPFYLFYFSLKCLLVSLHINMVLFYFFDQISVNI